MAPWDVDSAHPADDDIISQFPANERNSRSQIEGWMDYEHDKTTGRHKIPAGTTATRDGITEFVDGALWINTSFTPARLQMRVSGAWKDVGAGFAGDASIEGALTIVGSAATRLILERTGNANNAVAEFKTTDGSMFAGRANGTYFAIGSSNDLNTDGNRWFEVAADHARVRGDFYATGTITGNGSGLTNLNASNLSSGTLPNARLSGDYSFANLTLSGTLTVGGAIVRNGSVNFYSNDTDSSIRIRGGTNSNASEGGAIYLGGAGASIAADSVLIRVNGSTKANFDSSSISFSVPLSVNGTISGNGSGLTNLNASNISSGTLPAARLPNHSADLLTSGTLPAGRLSGNYSFGSLTLSGTLGTSGNITAPRIRLTSTTDASLSSTNHAFQIGPTDGTNLIMDGNEIMCRNNGAAQKLNINIDGGPVEIGNGGLIVAGNPVATVSTTGSASTTNFPVGHVIYAGISGSRPDRNSSATARLDPDSTTQYRFGGSSGTALTGTWRARGEWTGDTCVIQRTA